MKYDCGVTVLNLVMIKSQMEKEEKGVAVEHWLDRRKRMLTITLIL